MSSSAVGSPLLLMRSGVGDKDTLGKHQIPCIVNNPNVGRHLEDHAMLPILVTCKKGKEKLLKSVNKGNAEAMPGALPALIEWGLHGSGNLASSAYDANYLFRTGLNPDYDFPDGQIGLFCSNGGADLWCKFQSLRSEPTTLVYLTAKTSKQSWNPLG